MFNLSVQAGIGYLLIVASGIGSAAPLCASSTFIDDLLRRTAAKRVLLDMMAMTPELNDEQRQELLLGLAGSIARLERLAILMPRGVSLGLLLEASRKQGVDAMEFDDVWAAERWLCR